MKKKEKTVFFNRYKEFAKNVFGFAFIASYFLATLEVFFWAWESAVDGNMTAVVFYALFFWAIAAFRAVWGALVWGTIANIVLFIPYLAYRGFKAG